MNPSSAKLKIHARVIVFPFFSKINSKAAFRKAINKKSSFAFILFIFFFLRKASICTRLLTTTCSVALSRSEQNQLAERAARASAWGSSAKWNMPFERAPRWRRCWSDEDVCLCRARGWASLSDRYSDCSGMNVRNRVQHCNSARIPRVIQRPHEHAVRGHGPSLCIPDLILFHPHSSRSLL